MSVADQAQGVAADLERRIREAHVRKELDLALTVAVTGYGPELLGFLVSRLGDEDSGREVFADACEDMWAGLGGFEWRSSFRTWAYTVTRHACQRYLKRNRRRFFGGSTLPDVAERARTGTAPYQQTAVKEQFGRLRERLTDLERELLVLRVDRGLAWNEIAEVLREPDEPNDDEAVRRAAALQRKRFERVKERLKTLAREEGLLD